MIFLAFLPLFLSYAVRLVSVRENSAEQFCVLCQMKSPPAGVEKTLILEHKKVAICTTNRYIVTMLVCNGVLKFYIPLYCT